jgi:hypothetical protein
VDGAWSWEEAVDLVYDAVKMGVTWLAIGGGEPTEWDSIEMLIDAAASQGLKVAVTTNGTSLRPLRANRIQVSHDGMHSEHEPWARREAQVIRAVEYYKAIVPEVGINTLMTDAGRVGTKLLEMVDNITLMLPKPFDQVDGWREELAAGICHCGEHTSVYVDSCLSVLTGGSCYQGRTSMSLNQLGQPSQCSNIPSQSVSSSKLCDLWEAVRLRDDGTARPAGCLVDKMGG